MAHININNSQSIQIPSKNAITNWVTYTLKKINKNGEVSIAFLDSKNIQRINNEFRGKDTPTNVLAFPINNDLIIGSEKKVLGELIICPTIVQQEAKKQHKSYDDHTAHMIIHGILHLLGYTHDNQQDAKIMENLEIDILSEFNISNPYES